MTRNPNLNLTRIPRMTKRKIDAKTNKPFRLFALPLELRLEIYTHVHTTIQLLFLSHTSRTVYLEINTRPYLFASFLWHPNFLRHYHKTPELSRILPDGNIPLTLPMISYLDRFKYVRPYSEKIVADTFNRVYGYDWKDWLCCESCCRVKRKSLFYVWQYSRVAAKICRECAWGCARRLFKSQ
ncbi:hypothetical protein BJ508DRAFT_333559 [Ascobolus immersus RN42]|uniref:F-box domain-containing protein n=1 Tax=Ascobolus immersus RN42 TaxID=1160509 RepID=A0A3N4HQB5_ASCIM|nr:hypothetical protein BJ508DRAFT_333559 [Ascobolus immersus RN42]